MSEEPILTVSALILRENDGKILLLESPIYKNKYSILSGKVKFGETLEDRIEKDAKEKIGLDIEDFQFLGVSQYIDKNSHLVDLQFYCTTKIEETNPAKKRIDEYIWEIPFDALKLDLERSTKHAINSYLYYWALLI